jgi:hypothetical protein
VNNQLGNKYRDVESKGSGIPFLTIFFGSVLLGLAAFLAIGWGERAYDAKEMRDEIVSRATDTDILDLCAQIRKLGQEIVDQGLDDDNLLTVQTGAYSETVEAVKPIKALCVQNFFGQVRFFQIQEEAAKLPKLDSPTNAMPVVVVVLCIIGVCLIAWRRKAL